MSEANLLATIPVEGSPTELADLRTLVGRDNGPYWQGAHAKRLQERLAGLTESDVPEPRAPARSNELDALRKLAADDKSAYWNGPRSMELQARFAELLGAADEPVDEHLSNLAIRADDPRYLQDAKATANWILRQIPVEDRSAFAAYFGTLPDSALAAIEAELLLAPSASAPVATDEELQEFADTPPGAQLVREWGDRAGQKLGRALDKFSRIALRMPDEDFDKVSAWFTRLPPKQVAAIERALAG